MISTRAPICSVFSFQDKALVLPFQQKVNVNFICMSSTVSNWASIIIYNTIFKMILLHDPHSQVLIYFRVVLNILLQNYCPKKISHLFYWRKNFFFFILTPFVSTAWRLVQKKKKTFVEKNDIFLVFFFFHSATLQGQLSYSNKMNL